MRVYVDRLKELCEEHNVDMPENVLDLEPRDFRYDHKEVTTLLQDLYELYCEKCDLSDE